VSNLNPEDRDFILFLLSLEEDEFKMMLNSMSDMEALIILNNIQILREEVFDDAMEREGMKESKEILDRIMKL
jgi:hypothetical protein